MARKQIPPFQSINFSLVDVEPKNANQEKALKSENNLVLHGCAGTGKTFLALYCAFRDIADNKRKQVILIRSAVMARNMGFLPGNINEKSQSYEDPYAPLCAQLFQKGSAYSELKAKGILNFVTTGSLRGMTFDDAVIIIDEAQNLNFHELDSAITRVGLNSRLIFSGDFLQKDLYGNGAMNTSGLKDFLRILKQMEEFDHIEFGIDDIVRSDLVKNYLIAKHGY